MKMFNFISLFVLVLLFNGSLSFNVRINYYCDIASKNSPNVGYEFCVASLESNPRSQSASQLEELVTISIEIALSNATNISYQISRLLDNKAMDTHTSTALNDCMELYMDTNSTLHEVMDSDLKTKDYFKANIHVSAAMDSSTTCEDGFTEIEGGVSPLSKENRVFFELTAMILSFINMLTVDL